VKKCKRLTDCLVAAFISLQSQAIPNRETLEGNLSNATEDFEGSDIPHPPHWGGYKVVPSSFEFWQGRPSRLHDRFKFSQNQPEQAWSIDRLSP
ncbi:MAG: pyridoxine 5'-phosphate oxidase C-terminal domain-containing protein, partial [Pseudomonadota bacterium]|nr:pyridoxine 5'-phosphate oxidase C-terminal domain-containing protein [Pseudomonadota bacterium]